MRDAQPNPTHYALAALQHSAIAPDIITQNVDGLHHKAIKHVWDEPRRNKSILELHGTLHVCSPYELPARSPIDVLLQRVRCSHGHTISRQVFQDMLAAANPQWKAFSDDLERKGARPRTNPDGDVCSSSYQCDPFEILTRLYRLSSRKARDTTSLSCPIARVAYARSGQIR